MRDFHLEYHDDTYKTGLALDYVLGDYSCFLSAIKARFRNVGAVRVRNAMNIIK